MPVAEITRRLQAALVNRPSTLKPPADIAKLARMIIKIRSFMHSVG
jgi:hypothetical protein